MRSEMQKPFLAMHLDSTGLKGYGCNKTFLCTKSRKNLAQPPGLFSMVFSSSPSMVQFDTLLTEQLMHSSLGSRSKHSSNIHFLKAICIF